MVLGTIWKLCESLRVRVVAADQPPAAKNVFQDDTTQYEEPPESSISNTKAAYEILQRLERVYGGCQRCGELYCSAVVAKFVCGYSWKFGVLWLAYGEFLKTSRCKFLVSGFR